MSSSRREKKEPQLLPWRAFFRTWLEGTFWSAANVLYLSLGGSYMDVHM
jgi:hypothetical protein